MIVLSRRAEDETMREKLFTLSRTQSEDMWRRFKQTDDHRIAERLHAILLLDGGQNAEAVSSILHIHPKTLKRWVKAFASGGEDALTKLHYVGGDGWMIDAQVQQFTTWLDSDVRSTALSHATHNPLQAKIVYNMTSLFALFALFADT